jgi:hypothetical protein
MHHIILLLRPFEPGAILLALIIFSSLILTMVRGFRIPQCFYCGAVKVRPSRPDGFWDSAATYLLIKPYRCAGCRARFHAIRLSGSNL